MDSLACTDYRLSFQNQQHVGKCTETLVKLSKRKCTAKLSYNSTAGTTHSHLACVMWRKPKQLIHKCWPKTCWSRAQAQCVTSDTFLEKDKDHSRVFPYAGIYILACVWMNVFISLAVLHTSHLDFRILSNQCKNRDFSHFCLVRVFCEKQCNPFNIYRVRTWEGNLSTDKLHVHCARYQTCMVKPPPPDHNHNTRR